MWLEPVIDRTQADVDYANLNRANVTPNKGARTANDLNRISGNMKYLRDLLVGSGYTVPKMTSRGDWEDDSEDFPRQSDIEKFKADITALRNLRITPPICPKVPDLPYTHFQKINDIERIIFELERSLRNMESISYNAGAFYAFSGVGLYLGKSPVLDLPEYPVISTDHLPGGMVGDLYTVKIETISTSLLGVEFDITSGTLPEGLTLSEDGIISGRPLIIGSSDITITVTNVAGSSTKEFHIEIKTYTVSIAAGADNARAGLELYYRR